MGKRQTGMVALVKAGKVREILKEAGIAYPEKEAEEIVSHILDVGRTEIYRDNPLINEEQERKIDEMAQRRASREPLQYILGYAEFCGLRIRVGPGVLIPRPETEILVEEAIRLFRRRAVGKEQLCREEEALQILDLCSGSGCIAIALARAFPASKIYGTEISEDAIRYAETNSKLYAKGNVMFLRGSLFDAVGGMRFGLIVSNPPYIKKSDIGGLQPEIRDWEPLGALDGGAEGIDYYREIIAGAGKYLCSKGYLLLELGIDQGLRVKELAESAGLEVVSLREDFSGIPRVLIAEKRKGDGMSGIAHTDYGRNAGQ